jgi:WD40 repeat protein
MGGSLGRSSAFSSVVGALGHHAVVCFKALPTLSPLSDGTKGRYYSIDSDSRSGLLVAGGQGGKVALFRFRDPATAAGSGGGFLNGGPCNPPLLSFKPHGSTWVSDVVFCGSSSSAHGGGARGAKLLTSANDGCVALWDLTQSAASHAQPASSRGSPAASGAPKAVGAKQPWHRGGVWAMHATCDGACVATGSKDGGVGLGRVGPGGLELLCAGSSTDLARGPVKGVHIRGSSSGDAPTHPFGGRSGGGGSGSGNNGGGDCVVACACGDGSVVVLDCRDPRQGQGQLVVAGAHGGAACVAVEWRPGGCGSDHFTPCGRWGILWALPVANRVVSTGLELWSGRFS